jgi:RNA polymerase sigma factor (sigma-70 family)
MKNRHRDALHRILQGDAALSRDGRELRPFHLMALGGMRRVIDHPGWDESWSVPSKSTIDDLEEQGLVRVEPHGPNENGRTFSLTMKGREDGPALADTPVIATPAAPAADTSDPTDQPSPPTAVISWAHGDHGWQATIAEFAFRLREFGIDVDMDLWHLHDASVDWSTYGPQAIQEREFVLIPASAAYRDRWEEKAKPGTGAGAAREANTLKGLFDRDQQSFQRKVKIILLPGASVDDIPAELQSSGQRFRVASLDEAGLEGLLRTLTGQPAYVPPPLGTLPVLPPVLGGDTREQPTREPKDKLANAIAQLPERQKLVVALLYYEGLTLDDVASVLDVSSEEVAQLELSALEALGPMAAIFKERIDSAD